ncbi:MAG: FAD-dependent thymidylate synthase [Byssovorax sp.]
MSLDDAGSARVAPFVSSPTDPIYVVVGLPEATSARLLAATTGSDFRDELARGGAGGAGTGAEHAAVHLVIEGASRLAATLLVEMRPGACTLRSAPFDRRGFVEPAALPAELAARYREGMDRLLGTYLDLLPRVTEALRVRSSRVAAGSEIERAAALLRGLLPFGLATSVAISTDAKSLAGLLAELATHPLRELRAIGAAAARAAAHVLPELGHAAQASGYRGGIKAAVSEALRLVYTPPADGVSATMVITQPVRLLRHDKDALERIALALTYDLDPRAHAYGLVDGLRHATAGELEGIVKSGFARRGRGEPPHPALAATTMTFELMLDCAAYGDLLHARVAAPTTQRYGCRLGFDTPAELADLGFVDGFQDTLIVAYETWTKLEAVLPIEAQYAVPLGYRVRTLWTLSLLELVAVIEQCSASGMHASCRRIAHGLYRTATGAHPWLKDLVQVDLEGSSRA